MSFKPPKSKTRRERLKHMIDGWKKTWKRHRAHREHSGKRARQKR